MDFDETSKYAEEMVNAIYNSHSGNKGRSKIKNRPTQLTPLYNQSASALISSSSEKFLRSSTNQSISAGINTSLLLPATVNRSSSVSALQTSNSNKTNLQDFHYISHIQHRIASVSGLPALGVGLDSSSDNPNSSNKSNDNISTGNNRFNVKPDDQPSFYGNKFINKTQPKDYSSSETVVSNSELAKNIEQTQLQLVKESKVLEDVMKEVQRQYDSLSSINKTYLYHRKELGQSVEAINDSYVALFEKMLGEVMRIQRVKFKSQTKLVEDLQFEISGLNGKYLVAQDNCNRLEIENSAIEKERDQELERSKQLREELEKARARIRQYEHDHDSHSSTIAIATSKRQIQDLERKLIEATNAHEKTLKNMNIEHAEEIRRLKQILDENEDSIDDLKVTVNQLEKQISDINTKKLQIRPTDASVQTEEIQEDDDDEQDAVSHQSFTEFAHCPICNGNLSDTMDKEVQTELSSADGTHEKALFLQREASNPSMTDEAQPMENHADIADETAVPKAPMMSTSPTSSGSPNGNNILLSPNKVKAVLRVPLVYADVPTPDSNTRASTAAAASSDKVTYSIIPPPKVSLHVATEAVGSLSDALQAKSIGKKLPSPRSLHKPMIMTLKKVDGKIEVNEPLSKELRDKMIAELQRRRVASNITKAT